MVAEEIEGLARLQQNAVLLMLIDNINGKALRVKAHFAALRLSELHIGLLAAVVDMTHGQRGVFICDRALDGGAFEADRDRIAAVRLKLRAVVAVNGDVIGMQNVLAFHVGRLRLGIAVQRHDAAERHRDALLRRERKGLLPELSRRVKAVERNDGR